MAGIFFGCVDLCVHAGVGNQRVTLKSAQRWRNTESLPGIPGFFAPVHISSPYSTVPHGAPLKEDRAQFSRIRDSAAFVECHFLGEIDGENIKTVCETSCNTKEWYISRSRPVSMTCAS